MRHGRLEGYPAAPHRGEGRERRAQLDDDERGIFDARDRGWAPPRSEWRPDEPDERDVRRAEHWSERADDRRGSGERQVDHRFDPRFGGGDDPRLARGEDRFEDRSWSPTCDRFSESARSPERVQRGGYNVYARDYGRDEVDARGPGRGHSADRFDAEQRSGRAAPHAYGPHRGKGPAGFRRSDERIRELVCEALTDDDQIDATRIEVRVASGEVTLTGSVDDRRTKRLVEDCVERVPGVVDLQNQLRVGEARTSPTLERGATERTDADKKHRPS